MNHWTWIRKLLRLPAPKEPTCPLEYFERSVREGTKPENAFYGVLFWALKNSRVEFHPNNSFPEQTDLVVCFPSMIKGEPEHVEGVGFYSTPLLKHYIWQDMLSHIRSGLMDEVEEKLRLTEKYPDLWLGTVMFQKSRPVWQLARSILYHALKEKYGGMAEFYRLGSRGVGVSLESYDYWMQVSKHGYPEWPARVALTYEMLAARAGFASYPMGSKKWCEEYLGRIRRDIGKANWRYICNMKKMRKRMITKISARNRVEIAALRLVDLPDRHFNTRTVDMVCNNAIIAPYLVRLLRDAARRLCSRKTARDKTLFASLMSQAMDYIIDRSGAPRYYEVIDGIANYDGRLRADTVRILRDISRMSLKNLLEASRRWHEEQINRAREQDPMERAELVAAHAHRYHPKFKYYDVDGYRFSIVHYDELDAEGKRMHHCVGSYWKDVARRDCFIFHVSNDSTKEEATLEMDSHLHIRQLRGYCNEEVSNEMKKAARNLADTLCKEDEWVDNRG